MTLDNLKSHLADNVHVTSAELRNDLVAEAKHIADPAQCGNIVRRHFDGITFGLLAFVALFLVAAIVGIFLYAHR